MIEANNYQMAIDLLRCHLGLSEDEALQELGLESTIGNDPHVADYQQALLGMDSDK
ncbi:hypothetical protein [Vibrio sinensis]|uniref:hypothetical protein n=1 Tax=Vibrio sinensis TaxID=2302434 RepID=UPI0014042617|nr:hypothetical protein [Vibrio sinensis]